jgi:hypothetical protein
MSDMWVRRQGAELNDVFVLDKTSVGEVAPRRFKDDLNSGLGNFDFVIGFHRMLDHVENRRVAFPGLSRPHTTAITLSSQMLRCLFPSLETLQPKILQRHHSSSPGLSPRVKPCGKSRTASRLRGLTRSAIPVFWLPCLQCRSLPLISRSPPSPAPRLPLQPIPVPPLNSTPRHLREPRPFPRLNRAPRKSVLSLNP